MNEKEFFTFLDTAKQTVLDEVKSLESDGRKDEANILKAKSNVYDICKAVYDATAKQPSVDIIYAFPAALDKITCPWKASLDAAKAHDDSRKVAIEEAKLSAVEEIKAKFHEFT